MIQRSNSRKYQLRKNSGTRHSVMNQLVYAMKPAYTTSAASVSGIHIRASSQNVVAMRWSSNTCQLMVSASWLRKNSGSKRISRRYIRIVDSVTIFFRKPSIRRPRKKMSSAMSTCDPSTSAIVVLTCDHVTPLPAPPPSAPPPWANRLVSRPTCSGSTSCSPVTSKPSPGDHHAQRTEAFPPECQQPLQHA